MQVATENVERGFAFAAAIDHDPGGCYGSWQQARWVHMTETKPPESPCIQVCEVDEQAVCVGCGRTSEEIGRWRDAEVGEKHTIIENSHRRLADMGTGHDNANT